MHMGHDGRMSLQLSLDAVLQTKYFAVSKSRCPLDVLLAEHVDMPVGAQDHWLIPCSHLLGAPATSAEVGRLRVGSGHTIPGELSELLRLANGAELFRLRYRSGLHGDRSAAMYTLLSCSGLASANRELYDVFRSYAQDDRRYRGTRRLNYLAFCDVRDGDYLAVVLDGADAGSVFFLDHDYAFYPYGVDDTRSAYKHIAGSIAECLGLLAQTYGRAGMGPRLL